MTIEILFSALLGGTIGAVAAYALQQRRITALRDVDNKRQEAEQHKAIADTRYHDLEKQHVEVKNLLDSEQKTLEKCRERATTAETHLEASNRRLLDEQKNHKELFEHHQHKFKELAREVTKDLNKENTQKLQETSLNPLKDLLESLRKEGKETATRHGELKNHLENLEKNNASLGKEAQDLTNALKGSKVQGDYGEMQLERLLEDSGLTKDRDYFLQKSLTTEDGRRPRPDVIVRMPENRALIIDAKVSLTHYNNYGRSEGDEQKQALKDHLFSLRTHIGDLKKKDYRRAEDLSDKYETADYVCMFVPIEGALLLALKEDRDIFDWAFREPAIVLVGPTTLLATLRIVHHTWRSHDQQENIQEIVKVGAQLYDKLVTGFEAVKEVGQALDKAQFSYGKAENRLFGPRKDDVPGLAERLKGLGLTPKKNLPQDVQEIGRNALGIEAPQAEKEDPTSDPPLSFPTT